MDDRSWKEFRKFSDACPLCECGSDALQNERDGGNIAFYFCVNCGSFEIGQPAYVRMKMCFTGEVRGPEGRRRLRRRLKEWQRREPCPLIAREEIEAISNGPALPSAFKRAA